MPRAKAKAKSTNDALNEAVKAMAAADSFQNLLARTGLGSTNLMNGTAYPITRLTQNYALMNSLYRNSWLARRIIDLVAQDMLRNGWQYESDITPEDMDKLDRAVRDTQLKKMLLKGVKWGRLYGGAAGLIMLEGQEDILAEPLDLDSIMPGDFKGLMITDRWAGVYPQLELVDDISSPEFGLPRYYQFGSSATSVTAKVHHSRIIRFVGDDLPDWETQVEMYWGASVIENLYEELKKRDNTSANIAGLIFMANLRVLKMADLGEMLAGTNNKAQQDFYNTLQAQNWLQSNMGMYVMNKDDDFQQFALTNFSGINDIYESFMLDVAGAAGIPVTKLFGRSPAGMNATGEGDETNYNETVKAQQETHLRPGLEKLLPVLAMSALGQVPDDLAFEFAPIETPNEKEAGETVKWKSEAVFGAHDRGIISDRTALQELKQMSDGTGIFSNITDEDIDKANDDAVGAMLPLPPGAGGALPGDPNAEPSPEGGEDED